jgi:putative SOS response-associated peptidase YedK
MCGRYVSPEDRDLEQYFELRYPKPLLPLARCYNAAPSLVLPVVRLIEGRLVAEPMTWGLVPSWWSKEDLPKHTINARAEEAADKAMWRDAARSGRALVPAVGYYEWKGAKPPKQPYFIRATDGGLLWLAGLWSAWLHPDRPALMSYAILTTAASPSMSDLHHRMPVALPRGAWDAWLDLKQRDGNTAIQAALGSATQDFASHPVSTMVNSVRNNDPRLIDPLRDPLHDSPAESDGQSSLF